MKAIPYLYFNGNAEEAMKFYVRAFKSNPPEVMRYKEQPYPDMPAEYAEKILHAEIITEDCVFYISDAVGQNTVKVGNNLQINLNCDSEEQLRSIYDHLSEGAQIRMELQDTFWGAIFAMLTDQFSISWSLNYQKTQPNRT
ncbi:MAG TPA: VOC family protein [Desulfitobacteriaceae bacterium]|nr:VOC family protein [Desulfitobacteriaceae bacterium]